MSLLQENFVLKAKNGQEVIFSRPYLNDNKELVFLSCNAFQQSSPKATFKLNETDQAIEIVLKDKKRVLILLREENVTFFEKALKAKDEILNRIRDYMKVLQNGKEKIYIFETGFEECPYFFTSQTILDYGEYSIKFEKGLMYFINEKAKMAKKSVIFTDFMEMSKTLSENFLNARKDKFRSNQDDDNHYEMTFGDLLKIA